jgi:hypothetical protein
MESIDFSLRQMLDDSLKPFALRAHEKQCELMVDIRPLVPDALVGDPHRLRQILGNLVSNAIKFTDRGEVVVRVERTRLREDDRASLRFSVIDTGIGISREKQAAIFRPFTQGDGSTTRQYGGTGLGLTICQQLVELMGGRIWVESEPQRGSFFHFVVDGLPVQPANDRPAVPPRYDELVDMVGARRGRQCDRTGDPHRFASRAGAFTPPRPPTLSEARHAASKATRPFSVALIDMNIGWRIVPSMSRRRCVNRANCASTPMRLLTSATSHTMWRYTGYQRLSRQGPSDSRPLLEADPSRHRLADARRSRAGGAVDHTNASGAPVAGARGGRQSGQSEACAASARTPRPHAKSGGQRP